MTEVIIYDYAIKQRMIYTLGVDDFDHYVNRRDQTDQLLQAMAEHPFFQGCHCWADLDLRHLHVMIVNVLKIIGGLGDEQRADPSNAAVISLTFLLCCMLERLRRKDVHIDLLRVNRMGSEDVVYDYVATLDIEIAKSPGPALRVIVP